MFLTAIRLPKLRKIDRLFYMNLSSVEPELFQTGGGSPAAHLHYQGSGGGFVYSDGAEQFPRVTGLEWK